MGLGGGGGGGSLTGGSCGGSVWKCSVEFGGAYFRATEV